MTGEAAPQVVRTPIIPTHVAICRKDGPHELDLAAICVFVATGFFLGSDCYYRDEHALQPATEYVLDAHGKQIAARRYWQWNHEPRNISLGQAVDEFAHLFERLTLDGTRDRNVILPLSGGLDSRTLAAALDAHRSVRTYSYGFVDSFDETDYGRRIAATQHWPFESLLIPRGYLWNVIDELARINGCYSEFTHPRQMAVIDHIAALGDMFLLGHWGDVLFDNAALRGPTSSSELTSLVVNKIVKRGGIALASALWAAWGLAGDFSSYLQGRVAEHLAEISIDDANARLRAFKSLHWAPRWTTVNLASFKSKRDIALPYYDDEMCKLVCSLPEHLLAGRKIQIEYLKRRAPALAKLPWQTYAPLNLYSYGNYWARRRIPIRALHFLKRRAIEKLRGTPTVTRNWEIQFVGPQNDRQLRARLLEDPTFHDFVPRRIVERFYQDFVNGDRVENAHPVSMLLTMSMFQKTQARAAA